MNRLQNGGFEYGYGYFSGESYVTGISHWNPTGEKNASLVSVDQYPDDWQNRGAENRLILGGGIDGVEQVISSLKPNTRYRLTGWTFADQGESISMGVRDYGGEEKKAVNTETKYRRDIITFTTGPDNTTATIYIDKESPGPSHAYADDFGVIEEP